METIKGILKRKRKGGGPVTGRRESTIGPASWQPEEALAAGDIYRRSPDMKEWPANMPFRSVHTNEEHKELISIFASGSSAHDFDPSVISPLCPHCTSIDFSCLAWMNKPRVYKAYPGVLPNAGCINTTRSNFVKFRPKLGTVSGILARENICSLCALIARRIRQLGLAESGGTCAIQAVRFCTDRTAAATLRASAQATELTTTRMAVIHQAEGDWAWMSHAPERMLLQFQPCPTPVPTAAASIADSARAPTYGGRLLNPYGASPELLGFWLKRCEEVHGNKCRAQAALDVLKPVEKMLLIDVEDECIIEASGTERYAALSYVWGSSNTHRLLKENYDKLTIKGALAQLAIPATIRDAMTVTKQMGVRFVWVDALCIIQDGGIHKKTQIAQMASIYMHSLFTIIAVAGSHADAGLPGVRHNTRSSTTQEVVTTRTTGLIPLIDHLDYHTAAHHQPSYSTWYSRAWTMQEHVFSARKLIFARDQVYWHCSEARWVEETELEFGRPTGYQGYRFGQDLDPNNGKNSGLQDSDSLNFHYHADFQLDLDFNATYTALGMHDGTQGLGSASRSSRRIWILPESNANHLDLYRNLATKYMNRALTFESDRLNAFSGILTGLAALSRKQYIWALPESNFSWALAWTMPGRPRSPARHTHTLPDGGEAEGPLPSWSWLAWQAGGSFRLQMGGVRWTATPEIVFYRWDGEGGYRRVEEDAISDVPAEWDGVGSLEARRSRWKSTPATIEVGQHGSFDEEKDTGILRFWTSTVPVILRYGEEAVEKNNIFYDERGGGNGGNAYISGFPGDDLGVGAVRPISKEEECIANCEISLPPLAQSAVISRGRGEGDGGIVPSVEELVGEIVVISRRLTWDYTRKPEINDTEVFALVVYWEGGIAYRAGLLSIEESVWLGLPNRLWKMVTLG